MGKKEKHRQGQSRNNPVFKVANGRFSKTKGKAKEVTSKLKKVRKITLITETFEMLTTCFHENRFFRESQNHD